MPNTILFPMSQGSKPGDTPSIANGNVYYDCPTNPLVICDGALVDSGVFAAATTGSGSSTLYVDDNSGGVIPDVFKEGDSVYSDSGALIGIIDTINPYLDINVIKWTTTSAVTIDNNDQLKATYKSSKNRVVCYEIRNDGETPPQDSANDTSSTGTDGAAQYGVSSSATFTHATEDAVNRYGPSNGFGGNLDGYFENRENSSGYRIEMPLDSGISLLLSTSLLDTYDYFVMLFVDEPKKHHFAKITEISTSDVAGDSFEFSPAYGSDIPKGTKFSIWKGPLKTDTEVVAVSYGLAGSGHKYLIDADETDGAGTANDSRHSGFTYIASPNFYFYDDRLDKAGQLNHNTKYVLHCSRSEAGTAISNFNRGQHFQRCFLTEEDYGKRIVDYSRFSTFISLVDNLKTHGDIDTATTLSTEHYDSTNIPYTPNVSDWNDCFLNNLRNENDLIQSAASASDDFVGPKRYLHYTSSPQKVTSVPHVIDLEVFESATKTGTYMNLTLADTKRIYSKKIKQNDVINIFKTLDSGFMDENHTSAIYGTVDGTTSSTTLTFSGLEDGQDLRLLIRNGSDYDSIRIGNYNYRITAVAAPSSSAATQTITIDAYKLTTAGSWTTGISGAAETIVAQTSYRRTWSPITKTLMVDFNIDTIAEYSGTSVTAVDDVLVTLKQGNTTISYTDSKLYKTQICLLGGPQAGLRFGVRYGDQKNSFLKLDTAAITQQLYLDKTVVTVDFLAYYSGNFTLEKKVFKGYAEVIEDYIEEGQHKLKIQGRNDINRLLGPLVNKNYNYSEDIIYSTVGPYIDAEDSTSITAAINACRVGDKTLTTTSGSLVSVGDLVFAKEDGNTSTSPHGDLDVGNLIGEVSVVSGSAGGQTVTLLDGALCNSPSGNTYFIQVNPHFTFAKALEHTSYATQTPTSLDSTSSKGLFFTSGKTIVNGVEDTVLVNSSIHPHIEAVGYPIYSPKGISSGVLNKTVGDSSFMARLAGQIDGTWYYGNFDTPAAISNFSINNVDSNKGKGIIDLAPISPVVLARTDSNIKNSNAETLVDTGISWFIEYTSFLVPTQNYSIMTRYQVDAASKGLIGEAIYNSDGVLIGKVTNYYRETDDKHYIILDRNPSENGLTSISGKIYKISSKKDHNISFLNTQGINNGEVLQLINHTISTAGNTIPFNHQIKHDNTNSNSYGDMDFVEKYGAFLFRVYDIHKNSPGTLYRSKRRNMDKSFSTRYGNEKKYSVDTGNLQGFGKSYRTRPFIQNSIDTTIDIDFDATELDRRLIESPPDMKNLEPILGSNYEDYHKYVFAIEQTVKVNGATSTTTFANDTINVDTTSPVGIFSEGDLVYNSNGQFLGIVLSRTSTTIVLYNTVENTVTDNTNLWMPPSGTVRPLSETIPKLKTVANAMDWTNHPLSLVDKSSQGEYLGFKSNSISRAKDYLELLDPKLTKYYLFCKADLYPDCAKRKNSLFYGTRNISNYNLLLKSKGVTEESTTPEFYDGQASRELLKDDSYETVAIESANKNLNDLSRYNLMRLIEVTYDSQFNLIDPEKPPPKESGLDGFVYTTFNVVEQVTGTSTNPYITAYDVDFDTLTFAGDYNNLAAGDFIFTHDGICLGGIAAESFASGNFTLSAAANYDSAGNRYYGPIYKMASNSYGGSDYGYGKFEFVGRANQDTITSKASPNHRNHNVNLMQGAIFSATTNAYRTESLNFETSQLTNQAIMLPIVSNVHLNSNTGITFRSGTSGTTINTTGDPRDIFRIGDGVYDNTLAPQSTFIGMVTGTTVNTILISATIAATPGVGDPIGKYESLIGSSIGNHPSRILEKTTYGVKVATNENAYSKNRMVVLERHPITKEGGAPPPEAVIISKGASTVVKENNFTNKTDCVSRWASGSAVTTGVLHSKTFMDNKFQSFSSYDADGGSLTCGQYKAEGAYYVFKPVLYIGLNTFPVSNLARKIDDYYKIDDATNRKETLLLTFNNDPDAGSGTHPEIYASSGTIRAEENQWLDYAPNLTGYYLVSSAGKFANDANGGSLTRTNSRSDNAHSSSEIIPDTIHYIISHTKLKTRKNGSVTHHILIDNPPSATTSGTPNKFDYISFRVMRPAEICMYDITPDTIPLYTLSSKTTKMAFTPEMYTNIGSYPVINTKKIDDGAGTTVGQTYESIRVDRNSTYGKEDYDEAVLSMYVMIDPDNKSTSEYLIPRSADDLFGGDTESQPIKNGTYPFTLTDGNKTITTNITFSSNYTTSNNKKVELTFSKNMPEMIGAVSMGTPFTIISPRPVELSNPVTGKIGTTVTICQEAEDIIEDILESNTITYTDSTIEYPKYIAPNFQGIDVFTASNYLAKLKKKRLIIDVDTIKLEKTNTNLRFLPIEISDAKSDQVNVISIKKKGAAFSFYNHITVYGRGVKSTARNPSSIKSIGKKVYEEFDDKLTTETETNDRARALLSAHSNNEKTIHISAGTKGLEHLQAGDIITLDLPRENIARGPYMVLQIYHSSFGKLELDLGAYNKSMDVRLAELLAENKKVAAYLRGDRFKGNTITNELVDTVKIKSVKIFIKKTTTTSTGTFIGFTTAINTGTYTMGFSGLGQTVTTLLERDL